MFADLSSRLSQPIDAAALRAVNRAFNELRRGDPVVVETADERAWLAQPAEGAAPDGMARLQALSGSVPALLLTRRRGAALGLAPDGDGVLRITGRGAGPLPAELVRDLADPTRQAPPPAPGVLAIEALEWAGGEGAVVQLAKLARLLPAALAVPLRPTGRALAEFARYHDLLTVGAGAIADYPVHASRTLRRVAEATVPLDAAERTRIVAFRPSDGGLEHLAIVIGDPVPGEPVLARLHSECFTGDLLGSLRCDCGAQLRGAIAEIARQGSGIVLYLAQEGRGIGLINKLRAYRLQDAGADTVDANETLGFDADERIYLPAAAMLRQLGHDRVRLLTNNPDKLRQLARCGIEVVERVPHIFPSNGHNEAYLRTKAERSGHMF